METNLLILTWLFLFLFFLFFFFFRFTFSSTSRFLLLNLINTAQGLYELITNSPSFPLNLSHLSSRFLSSHPITLHRSFLNPNYHLSNPPSPLSIGQSSSSQINSMIYYPGLINSSSNLCFLNAVLQSLASMPHVIQYLNLIHSYQRSYTPVAKALREMLTALNTSRDHQIVLKPFSVAQALLGHSGTRKSMLFNSEQQDAQEFLVTMIDALEAEAKLLAEHLVLDHQSIKSNSLDRDQFSHQACKIRRSPFRGLMAHRIACATCGFTSVIRHSSSDHFSLNVPPKITCRLESCLQEYTKLEVLDEYICRKCSLKKSYENLSNQLEHIQQQQTNHNNKRKRAQSIKKSLISLNSAIIEDPERELRDQIPIERVASLATTKQTMFARPPDSLTFHISRSTAYARGTSFKNHCQVTYPEDLILDPYCTTFELSGDATKPISSHPTTTSHYRYRLFSVVVHFGSHSFGHYITYRKSPSSSTFDHHLNSLNKISSKLSLDHHTTLQQNTHLNDEDNQTQVSIKEDEIGIAQQQLPQADNKTIDNWYRISDETVQLCTIEDALRANPFLLMYERVYI